MDAAAFLESVKTSPGYRGQVVEARLIPRRTAVYANVDPPISGATGAALGRLGIERLYSHQAEAIQAVRRGEHIVVVTSTASGKTLCYNVPVLESLERDRRARALYIFPTKALAQDQLGKLRQLLSPLTNGDSGRSTRDIRGSVKAATYDGDTPRAERPFIKTAANIVLTNPDMLHVGILPYHTTWAQFLANLRYVIIDEVHTYRGVFGAHVANIIRRLRRIAAHYGANPQFVCASATVKDPADLVNTLIGIQPTVIDRDGSPSGEKLFVFWNPPFIERRGERRSANSEAVHLLTRLVESGIRTIVFTKARKTAELILRYARTALKDSGSPLADRIMAYRAGYQTSERREIERRLFSGELLGVTSTTALEVGVDIGGLDAVIMTGYPGTVASTWQQAGRAGRSQEQSMAVLIGQDNPMDQYLMRDPAYLLDLEHERAVLDPANPYILADHLLCATHELPIDNAEVEQIFGDRAWEVLGLLQDVDQLAYRDRWYFNGSGYPASNVNIRSSSSESYDIVAVGQPSTPDNQHPKPILGTVDGASAFDIIHPGAVYLHAGDSYVVTRLDIPTRVAYVEKTSVNYYTLAGNRTWAAVQQQVESRPIPRPSPLASLLAFGDVTIGSQVTHFWRKQLFTDRNLDRVPLDLPETTLSTEAVWFSLPPHVTQALIDRGIDLTGAIHAVEHAAIAILPLFAMCDRQDIGGVSHPSHPDSEGRPTIFIYDGHAGGVGIARAAYDMFGDLIGAVLKTIRECGCDDGCPSCIQSPKCGNNNQPLDKAGAILILEALL